MTGNSIYAGTAVFGKLLELLREAQPGIKKIGVFWGYLPPASRREEIEPAWEALRQAARTLGLTIHIAEVASRDQLSAAMAASDAERPDTLLVTAIPGLFPAWARIMEFAVKRRLPTIVDSRWPSEVNPYPLLAYGASREHLAPDGILRRPHSEGRQARRPADSAAGEVRAGGEPEDREGDRPDPPAVAAPARGRGDRVIHESWTG